MACTRCGYSAAFSIVLLTLGVGLYIGLWLLFIIFVWNSVKWLMNLESSDRRIATTGPADCSLRHGSHAILSRRDA